MEFFVSFVDGNVGDYKPGIVELVDFFCGELRALCFDEVLIKLNLTLNSEF
jgi:hypothetical protein